MRTQSDLAEALLGDAETAHKAACEILARQVAILGRRAEQTAAQADALQDERKAKLAAAEAAPDADKAISSDHEFGLTLARLDRSMRMNFALQTHTLDTLQRLQRDGVGGSKDGRGESKSPTKLVELRFSEEWLAEQRAAKGELATEANVEPRERREAVPRRERPEREDLFDHETRSERLARRCQEDGVHVNWAHIAALPWAQEEIASGKVGAPLQGWALKPRICPEYGPTREQLREAAARFRREGPS